MHIQSTAVLSTIDAPALSLYDRKLVLQSLYIPTFKEVSWHSFNLPETIMI